MNVIIYGFESVISGYSMKDICCFLLVFAVMLVLMGRMLENMAVQCQYTRLIRFQSYRRWWYGIFGKIQLLAVVMVGILFAGMGLLNVMFQRNDFSQGVIWPFVLWCINMCVIGSFLLLMGSFPRGFFLSFFIVIGVEVFSMYSGLYLQNTANFLPGSYMMLRRTTEMEGTMPVWLILLVEIIFIICIGVFGHRLYKRSSS